MLAESVIDDTIGGVAVRVEANQLGGVAMEERDSGRAIVFERDFWFAWAAFYPETLLYGAEG